GAPRARSETVRPRGAPPGGDRRPGPLGSAPSRDLQCPAVSRPGVPGDRQRRLGLPGRDREARPRGARDEEAGAGPVHHEPRRRDGAEQGPRLRRRGARRDPGAARVERLDRGDESFALHRSEGAVVAGLPRGARALPSLQPQPAAPAAAPAGPGAPPEKRPCGAGRGRALHRLIALHRSRWREFSRAFHTPNHVSFHEDITRLACARGWLRFFTLSLDDEPVAALYGFRYGRVFYFYQSGFDPAYAKF